MAKLSNDELIEAFKEMSLIELSDFVKLFEETFDVTAAAPAAVAVAAPAAGDAPAAEEKDEFEVVLESAGDKKIAVVKAVKALTGLGLKEAKDLVDGAPSTIFENAKKEDAEKAKAEIEEAGGKVTLPRLIHSDFRPSWAVKPRSAAAGRGFRFARDGLSKHQPRPGATARPLTARAASFRSARRFEARPGPAVARGHATERGLVKWQLRNLVRIRLEHDAT